MTTNPSVEEAVGYDFRRPELLAVALVHRSAAGRADENNEKLEFLGDAVLDLAISDLLMERFPSASEGDLSRLRASLVNSDRLAEKARELGLPAHLRLGRGEEKSGGRMKASILAAAYEAVLGALFLDGGFAAARETVKRHFRAELSTKKAVEVSDPKTRLQELTQRRFGETPTYKLVEAKGPDHAKAFVSEILIQGAVYGRGEGRSRKAAEQAAALEALVALEKPERA